jgi:hypothetical protein
LNWSKVPVASSPDCAVGLLRNISLAGSAKMSSLEEYLSFHESLLKDLPTDLHWGMIPPETVESYLKNLRRFRDTLSLKVSERILDLLNFKIMTSFRSFLLLLTLGFV